MRGGAAGHTKGDANRGGKLAPAKSDLLANAGACIQSSVSLSSQHKKSTGRTSHSTSEKHWGGSKSIVTILWRSVNQSIIIFISVLIVFSHTRMFPFYSYITQDFNTFQTIQHSQTFHKCYSSIPICLWIIVASGGSFSHHKFMARVFPHLWAGLWIKVPVWSLLKTQMVLYLADSLRIHGRWIRNLSVSFISIKNKT